MLSIITAAINSGIPSSANSSVAPTTGAGNPLVKLIGDGHSESCFPVAEFAQSAIGAAIHELQLYRQERWAVVGDASVDRVLAAAWCYNSVRPIGWPIPDAWDEFAGDYACRDGWIRLHTNAPHHREAALRVLGLPTTKLAAEQAVLTWNGLALESEIVSAGGASAFMMSQKDWTNHEQGKSVNSEPVVAWQRVSKASCVTDASTQPGSPSRPLQGIKILDLTRVLAGPVCTRFLASLGADVLRIDPPDWNEDGNALEMTIGKRCAGLDLNQSTDRVTFSTLLEQADVLVHGYRRDALQGLGFSDEQRLSINPNLIDVGLNAYGWTGPWRNRRGFDSLVQMSSGIASRGQQAFESNHPHPLPFQALDHGTGYLMAAATIRALREQLTTGDSYSARLSLARQAKLLHDLNTKFDAASPTRDTLSAIDARHMLAGVESTPWGDLNRLKFPYDIEGVSLGFDHQVSQLRTSPACW